MLNTVKVHLVVMRRYRGTFGWLMRLAISIRNIAIPSFAACGVLSANTAARAARAVTFRRSDAASAAASAAALSAAVWTINGQPCAETVSTFPVMGAIRDQETALAVCYVDVLWMARARGRACSSSQNGQESPSANHSYFVGAARCCHGKPV